MRRYQGYRSRKILGILKENVKEQGNLTIADTIVRGFQDNGNLSEFMFFTEYPKSVITKSVSLSNLTSDKIQIREKRALSIPNLTKFEIFSSDNLETDLRRPSLQLESIDTSPSPSDNGYTRDRSGESPSIFINHNTAVETYLPSSRQIASTSHIAGANTCTSEEESDVYANSSSYRPSSPSSDDDFSDLVQETATTSQNALFGDLNEGRKRRKIKDMNEWKKNKNKILRMEGKEYLGFTKERGSKMQHNKIRSSRQLGKRCKSKFCEKSQNRKCNEITDECRRLVFDHFWSTLNWDQRKVYIIGLVNRTNVSRKTSNDESRRNGTLLYFLPLDTDSNNKVQVCRNMFLNTFCLGSFTVQSWVKKANFGIIPCQEIQNDLRSRTAMRGVERKMLTVNSFLDNIPKLPSHYRRKESTKLYLEPCFRSITDLFNHYKKFCSDNEEPTVSKYTFEKCFNDKNLSLYVLKKDMCDICVSHAVGNIETNKYVEHINRKNRARREKEVDKARAARGEITLLTMDLEAVKVCPYLTASALYFKTKLTCHIFTVYNLTTHHTICYWFVETVADLTASTFASFILDYLEKFCLTNSLPIVIFSDGCTYQNRNNILSNALINFSLKHNVSVEQKFLEPGHTQMECDSVHSAIERKLKNREIYLPSDYIKATKEARVHPFPYETVDVDYSFIKNYADPSTFRYSSIRPGRKAGDPTVTNIRIIKYSTDGIIKIKLNFDEEWVDLPTRPKNITRIITYSQLNNNPLPISATKFNHLQSLKSVIPSDCHNYYDNLSRH